MDEEGGESRDAEDEDVDYSEPSPAMVINYRDGAQGPGAREEEIERFNNTVQYREYTLANTAA